MRFPDSEDTPVNFNKATRQSRTVELSKHNQASVRSKVMLARRTPVASSRLVDP